MNLYVMEWVEGSPGAYGTCCKMHACRRPLIIQSFTFEVLSRGRLGSAVPPFVFENLGARVSLLRLDHPAIPACMACATRGGLHADVDDDERDRRADYEYGVPPSAGSSYDVKKHAYKKSGEQGAEEKKAKTVCGE